MGRPGLRSRHVKTQALTVTTKEARVYSCSACSASWWSIAGRFVLGVVLAWSVSQPSKASGKHFHSVIFFLILFYF
ncbi:hypothetical protein EUGRSUZ_I00349 [Eucalyptus grandis]|uniref:Uncharacterized protein n=2 Tax=Eucalyptus grandis TaxID=71139 RepID=A0ACC3JC85_EUCGR|nr:hypothetical protein EUGRSUZ_I00349 [Eucalyptus grandis]